MSSMNSNDGPSSVTVTYQWVVVAIVACGVFAVGVITVMYRRRRAQAYQDGMFWGSTGTRLVLDNTGTLIAVPTGQLQARRPRKKLGPEPKLWDSEVGDTLDSGLDRMDQWHPIAVAVPERSSPAPSPESSRAPSPKFDSRSSQHEPAPHVDVTVLIAMPDPTCTPLGDDDYPLYHPPPSYKAEDGILPPMQLATTEVPFVGHWADVEGLRPVREPSPSPPGQVQRVRVDGFSRSFLRRW